MDKIIIKVIDEFWEYDNKDNLVAHVTEGEYEAELHKESGEYFSKDSEGRKFYVGELDILGQLELENGLIIV